MKISDAQERIAGLLGRDVELVQAKRMKNDVLLVITDDTIRHKGSGFGDVTVHTRRLTLFQGDAQKGQFILANAQMKGKS